MIFDSGKRRHCSTRFAKTLEPDAHVPIPEPALGYVALSVNCLSVLICKVGAVTVVLAVSPAWHNICEMLEQCLGHHVRVR